MLENWQNLAEGDEDEDAVEDAELAAPEITTLTAPERELLERCAEALGRGLLDGVGADPKWEVIRRYLLDEQWAQDGCILFSQYYDTALWVAQQVKRTFPDQLVGIYAGSAKN